MFGLPDWSIVFLMGAVLIPAGFFILGKTKTVYRRFLRKFPLDETEANVSKVIALVPAGLCGFFGVSLTWMGIQGIGQWIGYWTVQATGSEAANYVVFALSVLALIGISARQLLKKSA